MNDFLKSLGQNVSILGTQWGDEGKGKLVDSISGNFDIICRSTGGANAGHTIVTNGKKYVFHLLPSGLLRKETIGVVGNGCVVDLVDLVNEIKELEELGLEVFNRVKISLRAHLLFEYHKCVDAEIEKRKGKLKIGTTHRGIGPAYEDKISRIGIRCEDLLDTDLLKEKIEANCAFHSKNLGIKCNSEEEFERLMSVREKVKPLLADTSKFLRDQIANNKKILFEGAQAHHLDIDHGTYPFVTSSNVSVGGIFTGLGVPYKSLSSIVGIAKAYTTRVGMGPFPTELNNKIGKDIREKGGEYGATTGRPRRCGWFDVVVVKNSVDINGIDSINLTKLDILSGLKTIKIAIKYKLNGEEIFNIPTTKKFSKKLEIEYIEMPGWEENLSGITEFKNLPQNAQNYVLKLEELIGAKISSIGVGMDRNDLIFR